MDELQKLAYDLGIEWETLEGSTLSAKILELIKHAVRHNKLAQLRDTVARERP